MKRIIYTLLCVCALCACTKHEEIDVDLAVDSFAIEVNNAEGFTRIMVYGANRFSAEFTEATPWATIDEFQFGHKRGSFRVNYEANANISRVAKILIKGNGHELELGVYQKAGADAPSLVIGDIEIELPANRYSVAIPVTAHKIEENLDHIAYRAYTKHGEEEAECDWIAGIALAEDGEHLELEVARNTSGAEREAVVNVSLAGANGVAVFSCDVAVKQSAQAAYLTADIEQEYKIAPTADERAVEVATNIGYMLNAASVEVAYAGEYKDWIGDVVIKDGELHYTISGNDAERVREARITVSSTDADGNTTAPIVLNIKQGYYWKMSFGDLRAQTGRQTYTFEDSFMAYSIEGVVVSDCDSANNAFNPNTGFQSVDTGINNRTVYVQSRDGQYGMRLLLASGVANTFHRGDVVTLALNNATVKVATEPVAYSIEEVRANMIIDHTTDEVGTVVEKRKSIADLTDDDIYTYTTLSDMEFVFKQGAYTNVHESYVQKSELNSTVKNSTHIGDAAVRLMRDKQGRVIGMPINSLCTWRRAKDKTAAEKGVPQGRGSLHGIIVAEQNSRYGYKDGNIGKYAIRPVFESDIAGNGAIPWGGDFAATTLAEWKFDHKVTYKGAYEAFSKTGGAVVTDNPYAWEGSYSAKTTAVNKMKATAGDASALLWCDNLSSASDSNITLYSTVLAYRPHFADGFASEYVWDGDGESAVATGNWAYATDILYDYAGNGKQAHHWCGRDAYGDYVWVANLSGWYDWETGGTKGFNIALSTAAATAPVTLNFTMGAGGKRATTWNTYNTDSDGFLNATEGYYAQNYPLYWKVQYSVDGCASWQDGAVDALTGKSEFMLHPIPAWSGSAYTDPTAATAAGTANPNIEMALGLVEYSFVLPAEASGQANLIIRITPASRRIATLTAGEGNYAQPLDKGVDATQAASFGNMIHIGGIAVQY